MQETEQRGVVRSQVGFIRSYAGKVEQRLAGMRQPGVKEPVERDPGSDTGVGYGIVKRNGL
nr:hypothetical protein [Erwinia sp. Ejp617]